MTSKATTPEEYISELPDERKEVITKIRKVIQDNLPSGFQEGMGYGMMAYFVPHSKYPDGYHCDPKLPLPFINLASQKNFVALYHSGIYAKKELYDWFVGEYPKYLKTKMNMGKSCIRFKNMKNIPYDLIGELCTKMTADDWITLYEENVKNR